MTQAQEIVREWNQQTSLKAANILFGAGYTPDEVRAFLEEQNKKTAEVATPKANGHSTAEEVAQESIAAKDEPAEPVTAALYKDYRNYISAIFRPGDTLCIVGIDHTKPKGEDTTQFFVPYERAVSREYFDVLTQANKEGSIYSGMNTFKPELVGQMKGRIQENVIEVRAIQADADHNGAATMNAIQSSDAVPQPSIVVESSPGKFQCIWLVDGISKSEAKSLMQAIAATFNTDSAVAEVARVMRVPGFVNRKYDFAPVAHTLVQTNARYRREHFKITVPQSQSEQFEKKNADGWVKEIRLQHGQIYNQLVKLAGYYVREHNADDPDVLYALLAQHCETAVDRDGVTPFHCNMEQVRQFAEKWSQEFETGEEYKARIQVKLSSTAAPATTDFALAEEKTESVLSKEEMEAELDKEYPVIPLPPQGGPLWDDAILFGRLGEMTKKAAEYSESHPAGIYLDLLISIGNICGRNAYFRINNTPHYTNEFLVRVGPTSKGRKGGGRDTVDAIMALVDYDWSVSRVMSGFGSGEAVIDNMRDQSVQQVRDRKGNGNFKNITVPGVTDKRLCVRAGEIAGTFIVAAREGSLMSIILRDGWDGKPLRNTVKGKTDGISNSTMCKEPHLSVSGDCTKEELVQVMPDNSAENGFGNRFIYCYVHRVKLCPLGGPDIDWSSDVAYLQEVIGFAKCVKYVGLSKAAEKMWTRMYMELGEQDAPGLAGKMTARAAAHIRRLALIFALVDLSATVQSCHLKAARDIWDYCQQSAEYIFCGVTKEQARIARFVEKMGTATDRQICDEVFHRHAKMAWVKAQVDDLVRAGQLVRQGDAVVTGKR